MASGTGAGDKAPIDVEDLLVWVYRDNRAQEIEAERARRAEMSGKRISTDGVVALQNRARLGVKVDGSGPGAIWLADDLRMPEDAETVAAFVLELVKGRELGAVLLPRYARRGDRPDWAAWADPRVLPVWNRHGPAWDGLGRPKRGTFKLGYTRGGKDHTYCPVEWQDPPEAVDTFRLEFAHWRRALEVVADHFREVGLERHVVTGPAIAREPWNVANLADVAARVSISDSGPISAG